MNIAVVEPASSGTALIEAAIKLGKRVHVLSIDAGDRVLTDSVRCRSASIVRVDTNDLNALTDAVRRLHAEVNLQALIPGFEYMVDATAVVAERLGLRGLPPAAAACTRNKLSIREAVARRGLAGPAYMAVNAWADLEQAAAQVCFPAVLKPIDGSGSLMVRRVDNMHELRSAYRSMQQQPLLDMGRTVGTHAMLESYVAGREFSIEGVVDPSGTRVIAVTEKILGPEPHFVEMGHVVEAGISSEDRAALVAYIAEVVDAVGLTLGVFHAEARIGQSGPVLMEIAARLGGDRIYRLVELAKAVSLPALMIRSYCGEEHLPHPSPHHSQQVAGVRFLTLGEAGHFESVQGVDQVRAMEGCQEVEIYYGPYTKIPAAVDFRGRIGHILFSAPNRPVLDERLQRASSALKFLSLKQDDVVVEQ